MPLAFAKPLLMHTTACTERVYRIQHYSQIVAAYIILKTICSLMVSITALPRAHSDGVAYQDVKKHRYIIAKKIQCRFFMLNVFNYVTVSRAACKV